MTQVRRALRYYHVLLFALLCLLLVRYWQYVEATEPLVYLYTTLSSLGYALVFLLPVILLGKLFRGILRPDADGASSWRSALVYATVWLAGLIVLLLVFADLQLFRLYEYHINAFVWNLLTTPGGLAALGATEETSYTIGGLVVVAALALAVILFVLHRLAGKPGSSRRFSRGLALGLPSLLLATFLVTEGVYAFSKHTGRESYLQAASVLPFQLKSSATGFFQRLGVPAKKSNALDLASGRIRYPLQPINAEPLKKYPNIIWLTAESFRSDLISEEITPNLWAFAQESMNFNRHYSGGNRTRMGMFSMFYGLHAPYWSGFQEQRIRPVLVDLLIDKGYRFSLRTSQSFTYPELDDTVFSDMPAGTLMEALQKGAPWQRDRQNVDNFIAELASAQGTDPHFMFMFFEATHAPYTFPDSATIRPDYLKEMNYAKLNLLSNIDGIHDRYINAAHFVDAQVGRVLDHLKANDMLEDTIVLFTGDHGEEFMENGHWGHGHNNYFPEQQVRVPLLLSLPGRQAQAFEHETSHLQIPSTLMKYLGVTTPTHDYALAEELFQREEFLLLGNYNYVGVKTGGNKIVFPFTASDYFRYDVYDALDKRLPRDERQHVTESSGAVLDRVIEESRRFVL